MIMKKLTLLSLFLMVTLLAACADTGEDETSLNVVVPAGSPMFSQLYLQANQADYESFSLNVDTVQGADTLPAAFGSESHDIIFAPTNLGARLIDTGVPYSFAAAVTHGNLYLVSDEQITIESIEDLSGKNVTLFGQNATPDIVLRTLIKQADLDEEPNLRYMDSVQSALSEFKTDEADIVMLAEPLLSTLENNDASMNILDLQESWKDAFGQDAYPQSGVFIHDDVDPSTAGDYLNALEESIQQANESPESVADLGESLDVPFAKDILVSAIPRSHLKFVHAQDAKEDLEFYFQKILELNPALINDTLPSPSFYMTRHEE